jgi:hypothetical protein
MRSCRLLVKLAGGSRPRVLSPLTVLLQELHPMAHPTDVRPAAARHRLDSPEDLRSAVRQMELFEALDDAQRPLAVEAVKVLCSHT